MNLHRYVDAVCHHFSARQWPDAYVIEVPVCLCWRHKLLDLIERDKLRIRTELVFSETEMTSFGGEQHEYVTNRPTMVAYVPATHPELEAVWPFINWGRGGGELFPFLTRARSEGVDPSAGALETLGLAAGERSF